MPETNAATMVGNTACRTMPTAYVCTLDVGWLRRQIQEVAQEVVPQDLLLSKMMCSLLDACALASIGDTLKQRFQFAVLLDTNMHHKHPKSGYERYMGAIAMRAMSGHTGSPWVKTPRYAVRTKPEDAK